MWKTVSKDILDKRKVSANRLRFKIDPAVFPFETTAEVGPLHDGIIGQERAVRAMEFGLQVRQSGYNLFVMGPPGTIMKNSASIRCRTLITGPRNFGTSLKKKQKN